MEIELWCLLAPHNCVIFIHSRIHSSLLSSTNFCQLKVTSWFSRKSLICDSSSSKGQTQTLSSRDVKSGSKPHPQRWTLQFYFVVYGQQNSFKITLEKNNQWFLSNEEWSLQKMKDPIIWAWLRPMVSSLPQLILNSQVKVTKDFCCWLSKWDASSNGPIFAKFMLETNTFSPCLCLCYFEPQSLLL